ncbi:MAG: DNA gyrase subunit A [Chloroflexales bacterium]|nr:DNA gyrase subunit A [Chloroflexales bacterium]
MEIGVIRNRNISDEMRTAYLDYAMSVIVSRALPDTRDGLKPVQTRILYGMWEMGMRSNQPSKKCARIVGDVLGKMHPHGDSSVYDALARLAQPWNMRYPLIDGQGNFGSIDGDPPAAMRYTEARLSAIAEEMLFDIDRNTVDFRDNFDGTFREPTVLPARLPNLLLNGANGIAVGMATNIPPHNLNEICQAITFLIDNPDATVEDLIKFVPGPDLPTGGLILGNEGINAAYSTGRGQITIRAKAHVEEGTRKARLQERIAELVREKKIEGIRDIRDESDRTGMRVVIMLKQDAQPRKVLNALYKHTQMQTSFGINMLSLIERGLQPRLMTLKRMLQEYIDHRREVIRRRSEFDLEKARARAHILEGLTRAIDILDEVIHAIRESRSRETARNNLIRNFSFSEAQANAILDMQLGRLAALERKRLEEELAEVRKTISELEEVLNNEVKLNGLIKADLKYLMEKYGDARRTQIIYGVNGEVNDEDLIPDEKLLITLSNRGYIKSQSPDTFRTQKRGGKGIRGSGTRDEDVMSHILMCNTMHDLLFFTNSGRVYRLKAHEVPDASRTAKGLPLVNLIDLQAHEHVTSVLSVPDYAQAKYLLMATRRGKIKRTTLEDYSSVRSNGLLAIGLDEGDELGWVTTTMGEEYIMLTTRLGKTLRFKQAQVRPMGRPAGGVRGISLRVGDEVISMDVVSPEVENTAQLVIIGRNGKGKRTPVKLYRPKGRGTQGMQTMTLTDGDTVAIARVIDADMLLTFITSNGIVLKTQASEIRACGRSAQGVRILSLNENDAVVAMVADDPENEDQKHKRILDIGDMIGVDMFEEGEESDEGEEDAPIADE